MRRPASAPPPSPSELHVARQASGLAAIIVATYLSTQDALFVNVVGLKDWLTKGSELASSRGAALEFKCRSQDQSCSSSKVLGSRKNGERGRRQPIGR